MNVLDAVAEVLSQAGGPLHYREITGRVLSQELWTSRGKTPWATVNARLAVDLNKHGSTSRFVRFAPGVYALNPLAPPQSSRAGTTEESVQFQKNDSAGKLSFTDAAEQILRERGNREPMHYRTITERALEFGLINSKGRTPQASMYAMILTEIKRHVSRGHSPRFVQHGRGMVGLASWTPSGVARLIEDQNREVREALLDWARSVLPDEFEQLVGELLVAMGFEEVEVTNSTGDGGIDVRGTLVVDDAVRIRMAVQAKRWKNNVQSPEVQRVRGSLGSHEQGLIITTGGFSKGAREEATRADAAPVALVDGDQMAVLLAKHEIGVRSQPYKLLTLTESDEGRE